MIAFVTSDPHGYIEPLQSIVEFANKMYNPDYFIFLGDYVDNGKQSFQVLKYLKDFQSSRDNVIVLSGNHDKLNLMYSISHWHLSHCRNYLTMSDTMKSFIDSKEFLSFEEAQGIVKDNEELFSWVDNLPTSFIYGDTIFTHAGVNPRDFSDSYYHIMLHPHFIDQVKHLPFKFVIGHINVRNFTKHSYPFVANNLVMTDTNAYRSGVMYGLIYDLEQGRILETMQKEVDLSNAKRG